MGHSYLELLGNNEISVASQYIDIAIFQWQYHIALFCAIAL